MHIVRAGTHTHGCLSLSLEGSVEFVVHCDHVYLYIIKRKYLIHAFIFVSPHDKASMKHICYSLHCHFFSASMSRSMHMKRRTLDKTEMKELDRSSLTDIVPCPTSTGRSSSSSRRSSLFDRQTSSSFEAVPMTKMLMLSDKQIIQLTNSVTVVVVARHRHVQSDE